MSKLRDLVPLRISWREREELVPSPDQDAPAPEPKPQPVAVADASISSFWSNESTGLGTAGSDKTTWHLPGAVVPLPLKTLAALWLSDPIARTVVEAVVDDGLKEGFQIRYAGDDPRELDLLEQVEARALELGVEDKIRLAAKSARALGGSALLLVEDEAGSTSRLVVADPRDLVPHTWDMDTPSAYTWAGSSVETCTRFIDAKDLIIFSGIDTPLRDRRQYWQGWHRSVLQHVWETIRDYRSTWQSTVAMVQDGSQAILKLQGLSRLIASGGKTALIRTLQQTQLRRWVGRIMPIDAEESYDVVSRSYAGIGDILKSHLPLVAMAADMPITRLFGESPGGLGSNGQGEQKDWRSTVQSWRRTKIQPPLTAVIRLLAAEAGSSDLARWGIYWPTLEVLTAGEEASVLAKEADTDAKRVTLGMPKATILTHRYGGSDYRHSPPVLTADDKAALEDPEEAAGPADPTAAFTGVQTREMRETLIAVARGLLPRDSGIESLLVSLPIDRAQAERLMGAIGKGFQIQSSTSADTPRSPYPEEM